jgi:Holliday junction resolvase RusA-like endonuclease
MTDQILIIPGRLPGLNEIIAAASSGRGKFNAYGRMKREESGKIGLHIRAQRLRPVARARLAIRWIEPNVKRDPDNIRAGIKFILDALVDYRVLPGDTQEHIAAIADTYGIDRHNPRIEVTITPDPGPQEEMFT